MIEFGPLSDIIPKTGEEFIRLPGGGRIDTVTSSAQSRLGQRVTFVPQDECGLWTQTNGMARVADTQYRGLAGMGGRASITTNAWNPAEGSVAQVQYESSAKDIYRLFRQPPANLSYRNKVERRKIHQFVYGEALKQFGGHVDLDAIEAEAYDLIERDISQAERFFGNRIVASSDAWIDPKVWAERASEETPIQPGDTITIGFDGSLRDDSTALVGCRVSDGLLFLIGIWECPLDPDAAAEWEVPVGEVDAAVARAFETYNVERMYCDPAYWQDVVGRWASQFGEKRVIEWWTNRERQMVSALERFHTAVVTSQLIHDNGDILARHIGNAKKKDTRSGIVIRKDRPKSANKIDAAVCAVLAYEARGDVIQSGVTAPKKKYKVVGF
jgi:peptidyl-tRNA hydrolase